MIQARPFFVSCVVLAVATTSACAQAESDPRTVEAKAGKITVEVLVDDLEYPWGMTFLPDGRLLLTEREGRLRILGTDNKLSPPITGVPAVRARGQGGLLDVALDPDFASNDTIYFSYAEAGDGGASTALARATLRGNALADVQVIFRQEPKVGGGNHFGGRIVFAPDGHLFLTTGERYEFEPAQDLGTTLGKIVRINRDGSIPPDNPFAGRAGLKGEIWSYGHRNVQGAAFEPDTGALWATEFGPRGGDELNLIERGKNYGWPLVSWGTHYNGEKIPNPPTRPDLTDAVKYWNPVISPSGIAFYTGDVFPAWKGNLLIAGLSSQALTRVKIENGKVVEEERIAMDERIRDVEQAPDGSIYLLTDDSDGEVWRLRLQR